VAQDHDADDGSIRGTDIGRRKPKPHQPRMKGDDEADSLGNLNQSTPSLKYFVEIFSGCGSLSMRVSKDGVIVHTFDIVNGKKGDICNAESFRLMKKLVS
jgi:hypothetical protein